MSTNSSPASARETARLEETPMRSTHLKIIGTVVAAAVAFTVWIVFAPTKLGGTTTYSVTSGISMQPLLYKNDLSLVRTESSYHVGQVVLYNSPILHKQVLHRIFLIQDGHYYFKGDNNNFVDPGYATQAELVGTLWFHVPEVGGVLSWFGKPLHAAIVAALAAMAVVLSLGGPTAHRRRRRRSSPPRKQTSSQIPIGKAVAMPAITRHQSDRRSGITGTPDRADRRSGITMTPAQLASRRAPAFFEGPTPTLVAMAVLVLLGGLFLAVGFSRPASRIGPVESAYRQTGSFSYSGVPIMTTQVYPSGLLDTGDPIYPSLVNTVKVQFKYRFLSTFPHHITGTIELRALVLSQANTWHQPFVVQSVTPFRGDSTTLSISEPIASLYTLIDSVSTQTGAPSTGYTIDLQPLIHVDGTVGSQHIAESFAPVLPFTASPTAITLNVTATPAPPGATYTAPTPSSELSSMLNPVQTGSISHLAPNVVSVARYAIRVTTFRDLGLALLAIGLAVAVFHDLIRRRKTMRSVEETTARRLGAMIVPVDSLGAPDSLEDTEVRAFDDLARLAQFLERPILYEVKDEQRTFAVDDESRRYFFRPAAEPAPFVRQKEPASPPVPGLQAGVRNPRSRLRRSLPAQGAAALLLVVVAATVTAGFTASTNVPASHVGSSVQAGTIAQLRPTGCSSLTLSSLVAASGTFTNTASHALIVGTSGVDKITDDGSDNCIVGGGGKDTVKASPSDVCIVGPTKGATYTGCTESS